MNIKIKSLQNQYKNHKQDKVTKSKREVSKNNKYTIHKNRSYKQGKWVGNRRN